MLTKLATRTKLRSYRTAPIHQKKTILARMTIPLMRSDYLQSSPIRIDELFADMVQALPTDFATLTFTRNPI
jgi:hypothetical protein